MREAFDRFADHAERFVSSPAFFAACVIVVLLWAPSYFAFGSIDTWQLVINTLTTIITFLLVALLQNTAARSEDSTAARLIAIMDALGIDDPIDDPGQKPRTDD